MRNLTQWRSTASSVEAEARPTRLGTFEYWSAHHPTSERRVAPFAVPMSILEVTEENSRLSWDYSFTLTAIAGESWLALQSQVSSIRAFGEEGSVDLYRLLRDYGRHTCR